jgi:type II secretory pathway component PulK
MIRSDLKPFRVRRRPQSGQALLVALGVTVILVSMLAVTAANQRSAMQAESGRMAQRRTYLVAESAANLALQYLMEGNSGVGATTTATATTFTSSGQMGPTPPADTTAVSTLLDDWATVGETGGMKFVLADTSFRVQIVDTSSLLDVNESTAAELVNIGLTPEQADCINDYHTAGETPAPDGAKDSYYNGLSNPYNAKLARFDTLDELLQVEWITPDILYDPQNQGGTVSMQALTNGQMPALYDLCTTYAFAPNTTATGGSRMPMTSLITQLSGATQAALYPQGVPGPTGRPGAGGRPTGGTGTTGRPGAGGIGARTPTYTTIASVFRAAPQMSQADARVILNSMATTAGATTTEGLVNINTASQNVLMLLPNMTPEVAGAIVSQQQSGFSTLGDILTVGGVSNQLLASIAGQICIASTTYEARIIATAGTQQAAYTAIVQVSGGVPQIVSITPTPFPASQMILRWGWQTDTTDETDLVQQST